MSNPLLSIVIPTHNRCASLLRCLGAIGRQADCAALCEVIVVVDGSTDGTAGVLGSRQWPFPLQTVSQQNLGAGVARNAGAAMARGEYLAFLEDDVLPADGWLAIARKILAESTPDVLEGRTVYAGTEREVRRFEPDRTPSFIPCNLIVRRKCFVAVGGYSPDYFDAKRGLYFREDSDFGFRLIGAGYAVSVDERLVVSHPPQFASLRSCFRHALRYVFDPLLFRRHPALYRRMIEVKHLFGMTIHRPLHFVALADVGAAALVLAGSAVGSVPVWVAGAGLMLAAGTAFRFRYQGWKALQVYRPGWTMAFVILPFVYLCSLLRGCFRYRTFGVMV